MKKAIVIGASSGIGRALAKKLAAEGYELGLASRRTELLLELGREIGSKTYVKRIDISDAVSAQKLLRELIDEMGGVGLIVINSGISVTNRDFCSGPELETIAVNVSGFAAMMNVAVNYFLENGAGHIVGISSIAGLRGAAPSPAYNASKAFVSNYMEGMRQKLSRTAVAVTDIRPGFIDTPLIEGHDWAFWTVGADVAASQIYGAIRKKKKVVYVPKRWYMIALLLKILPEFLYHWGYNRIVCDRKACLTGRQGGKDGK